MRPRALIVQLAVLVVMASTASALFAQGGVGAISGTIVDASGGVMPGVAVTLSSPGLIGGRQETVTNERGLYQFTRLVPAI